MTGIFTQIAGLLLALSVLAGSFWGYGEYKERAGASATAAIYDAALARQKAQAAEVLASAVARVQVQQQQLDTQLKTQETQDEKNKQAVAGLNARVRALVDAAGRLRDPNAAGFREGGDGTPGDAATGTASGAGDGAAAGGLVSAELTKFLFAQAASADAVNTAYASCRADALGLRKAD